MELVQALPVSCCGPPSVSAVEGEEAGAIPEVKEEGGQCSGQDGNSDHDATPTREGKVEEVGLHR